MTGPGLVTGPAPARQAGTTMVLVMLAMLIMMTVAYHLTIAALVEFEHSQFRLVHGRLEHISRAATRQAESVLLLDLEEAAAQGDSGNAGTPGAASALSGAASPTAEGGDGGETDVTAVTATTDSMLDEWMNPEALSPAMGEGLQIFVEIVDEDSKINLLGIFSSQEDEAEETREIVKRLIDVAFEGTTHDIDFGEATDFLDSLDEWARGSRGSGTPVPTPELKPTDAQESDETYQLETALFDDDENNYPLSLDELVLMGAVERHHLDGFVENGEHFPGLREYLTLYSHLELKAEPEEESEFAASPFGQPPAEEDEDADEDEITAASTHQGLINVNTAPLAVLRAVAGDEIPRSALELVVEFREKIHEFDDEGFSGSDSMFSGGGFGFGDGGDGGATGGTDDEEDVTDFVFSDPSEVFTKIEREFSVQVNADSLAREAFEKWFWVESQVFTIKVLVREPTLGVHRNYRSMVWRMNASDRPRIVILRPLEPYTDSRRMEDYPGGGLDESRLEEMATDRMIGTR